MESRRLVITLTLLSLSRQPRMYMVLFVITFPMLLLILMGMASPLSVWEVKGTEGSQSISSLASSSSWRVAISLFPKLENFCVIRRNICVSRGKAWSSECHKMPNLLTVSLLLTYTICCITAGLSLSISPVVLSLFLPLAIGRGT